MSYSWWWNATRWEFILHANRLEVYFSGGIISDALLLYIALQKFATEYVHNVYMWCLCDYFRRFPNWDGINQGFHWKLHTHRIHKKWINSIQLINFQFFSSVKHSENMVFFVCAPRFRLIQKWVICVCRSTHRITSDKTSNIFIFAFVHMRYMDEQRSQWYQMFAIQMTHCSVLASNLPAAASIKCYSLFFCCLVNSLLGIMSKR